jgi:hypothetical protein
MKLARYFQKLFGTVDLADGRVAKFGSLAGGSPAFAANPADVQSQPQFTEGWVEAVMGLNYPAIEDENALDYLWGYQLAYLFQQGVPEWESTTTYYFGSIVTGVGTGMIYTCVNDNAGAGQSGNVVTNGNFWRPLLSNGFDPQMSNTLAGVALKTWISETTAGSQAWYGMCWSTELNLFVAVAESGADRVMTSPDGITWTGRSAATANTWHSVAWSPQLSLFAAVSVDSEVMTSPDGITWTSRVAPAGSTGWLTIIWCPELSIFVAVGLVFTGTVGVMTSPDGITWTAHNMPQANEWSSVCWSPELELLVAVSENGANRVATSPDGITWTAQSAASAENWYSVCWSSELGLFCAVSLTGGFVMTSGDGVSWHNQTPFEADNFLCVTWCAQLGCFVLCGSTGTYRVQYSFNGINWFGSSSPAAKSWSALVFSPKNGYFSAVSNDVGSSAAMISTYVQKIIF